MPIRIIVKLIFWIMLFGILGILTWFYLIGKQKYVFWFVGIFLVAEIAHYLRKSRERVINVAVEESGNIQDQLKNADLIKKEKPVGDKKKILNKTGLLLQQEYPLQRAKKKKVVVPVGVSLTKGKKEKVVNSGRLLKDSVKVKIVKKKIKK